MGLENLSEDSTPCEICKEIGLADERYAQKIKDRFQICHVILFGGDINVSCLQKDRAIIKLQYLNLIKNKNP